MKRRLDLYTFDPTTKTIYLNVGKQLKMENVLLVVNLSCSDSELRSMYNFSESKFSNAQLSDNILYLPYLDTSLMTANDDLSIWIDYAEKFNGGEPNEYDPELTYDTNMQAVFGSQRVVNDQGQINVQNSFRDSTKRKIIYGSNSYVDFIVDGMATLAVGISGTWSGTISFEAALNDQDFNAIYALDSLNSTSFYYNGRQTSSNGIYRFNCTALRKIRIRFTSYTSGNAILDGVSSPLPYVPPQQLNGSLQTVTQDGVLGATSRPGFDQWDWLQMPTVSPSFPTPPTSNLPMRYPQKRQSTRVSLVGDQKILLPQKDNTYELKISWEDLYRLTEMMYLQIAKQTEILATVNNFSLPAGWDILQ